jgi:hypothetical protein
VHLENRRSVLEGGEALGIGASPSPRPRYYVSYAWSDEGKDREAIVDRLCDEAEKRKGGFMNEPTQRETPHVGIFWVAQTADGEARLLAAGCPLDQAEPYGDCLTYSPGHYEIWENWRRDKTVDPARRAIARSYGYEDWPRGIVFDRARDLFILYADRKLLTPAMIARIQAQFHLPAKRTEIQSGPRGFPCRSTKGRARERRETKVDGSW